jgi:hypothetical protein
MTDMGTLLADFLSAVAPSAPEAAAASSVRAPRESQRSRLRSKLRIGVNRRREIITGAFRSA